MHQSNTGNAGERRRESTERVIAARAFSPSASLYWPGQADRETHGDSESVTVTLALANGVRRASPGAVEGSVAADWLSCHTHADGAQGGRARAQRASTGCQSGRCTHAMLVSERLSSGASVSTDSFAAVTVSRGLGANLLEGRRKKVATPENKSKEPRDPRSNIAAPGSEFCSTPCAKRKCLQTIF